MRLGQTLVTAAISALLSGAVGFASALYLQTQANEQRIAAMQEEHKLALDRIALQQRMLKEERRSERALALRGRWTSEPMITQRRQSRSLLDRYSGANYLAIRERAVDETSTSLDRVLAFWNEVYDDLAAGLLDVDAARLLLGPDAAGWSPDMSRLLNGLDTANPSVEYGHLIYAQRAVATLRSDAVVPRRNPWPNQPVQ